VNQNKNTNMKKYYLRFISATPKVLAKLRNLCLAVSVGCLASLAIIDQYSAVPGWKDVLVKVAIVTAGIAAGLQMSTSSKEIQKLD
jgi:hypothetical protein